MGTSSDSWTGKQGRRMLGCCEEILKEKKGSLCCQPSMLDLFRSSSGTRVSPPVLLDIGDDDPYDLPAVHEKVSPLKLLFLCQISYLL